VKKILFRTFAILATAALLLFGCAAEQTRPTPEPVVGRALRVTTTIGMITDLTRQIAGPHAVVTGLMGPGTDPHLYKARERDIRALAQADIVFYNGLHLEGKMVDVLENLARRQRVIAVTERIDPAGLRELPGAGGAHDPHVWFDVSLWMQAAERIRDGLIKAAPAHRAEFEANAADLRQRLSELHDWCRTEIARIPKERRVLITAHDAFGYFGRAYDIDVRGIQGISTEDEASVNEINALVAFIAARGIKAVFVESSVSRKNIEALVEGARARDHELRIGGQLFSDAMGAADTPEGTYVGMVRHNVSTITAALR
jgi:manganese/zinc/iron transport system substrate-binding protein